MAAPDPAFTPPSVDPASIDPASIDPGVLADVKAILRDSLRLGADVSMGDDMPLVGGNIDLDSIDILLVISNIEKHFKIKIPNEAVGRTAFASVATLAKYVADNKELLKVTPGPVGGTNPADLLARLPHGPEFRFVTAVREVSAGVGGGGAAVAHWDVTGAETFLKGHFPGRPVVPGVLITEALAQVAGIALSAAEGGAGGGAGGGAMLAATDIRFLAPVVPPASIELRAERAGGEPPFQRCRVTASVGGRAVATGTIELVFNR